MAALSRIHSAPANLPEVPSSLTEGDGQIFPAVSQALEAATPFASCTGPGAGAIDLSNALENVGAVKESEPSPITEREIVDALIGELRGRVDRVKIESLLRTLLASPDACKKIDYASHPWMPKLMQELTELGYRTKLSRVRANLPKTVEHCLFQLAVGTGCQQLAQELLAREAPGRADSLRKSLPCALLICVKMGHLEVALALTPENAVDQNDLHTCLAFGAMENGTATLIQLLKRVHLSDGSIRQAAALGRLLSKDEHVVILERELKKRSAAKDG